VPRPPCYHAAGHEEGKVQQLVDEVVQVSREGPLLITWTGSNAPAQRYADCMFDDGQGGLVFLDHGLWEHEIVSWHPMHALPAPKSKQGSAYVIPGARAPVSS
jgi:hypothetical protein